MHAVVVMGAHGEASRRAVGHVMSVGACRWQTRIPKPRRIDAQRRQGRMSLPLLLRPLLRAPSATTLSVKIKDFLFQFCRDRHT